MALILIVIRELIIYGIEFCIFLFVFNAFYRTQINSSIVYSIIGLIYIFIIGVGEYKNVEARNIIYYFYIFITCFYIFKGSFRLKIGVLFLGLCLDLIVEEILILSLSIILKKDYIVVSESKLLAQVVVQYMKIIILCRLGKICIPYINKKSKAKRYMYQLGRTTTTLLILIPVSSYVILAIWLETFWFHLDRVEALIMESAVMCCLFGINIVIIVLINKIVDNKEYEYTNAIIKEQIATQFNHYKHLERMNKETRRLKHDMKNHIICIQSLLKNDKKQEAMVYIENLTKRIEQLDEKINTGDTIIDAILQEKAVKAKEQNIEFKVIGKFVASLNMEAIDKCTLLANAIDNAIESCIKIPEVERRMIEIEIAYSKEYIIVSIKNPIAEQLNIIAGKIKTSKKNKRYHGFGIENMKEVIDKYGAYLTVESQNNIFKLEFMLQIEKDEIV